MKTTNLLQKTENKKLKNAISKTFAVVVSLVLISLTVSANGFRKQILVNNTFGKMIIPMMDENNAKVDAVAFPNSAIIGSNVLFMETAKEKDLEIESWMTDKTYFGSKFMDNQLNQEKPLEIESWMIDHPFFKNPANVTETEPALKIENWMTDSSIWKTRMNLEKE